MNISDELKKEIENACMASYAQGRLDTLHSVRKAISVLDVPNINEPITIKDILMLVDLWQEDAKKELHKACGIKEEQ